MTAPQNIVIKSSVMLLTLNCKIVIDIIKEAMTHLIIKTKFKLKVIYLNEI